MKAFVLKRRADERVVTASMIVLLGLGTLASVLGAVAAADAAGFWQNFVAGIALLAAMTIPIWFVQRWQATARPAVSPERIRALRRTNFALLALWLSGMAISVLGLAMNVGGQASLEADVAVGLLIVYMAGWGLLVFRVLLRPPSHARRLRGWFGARSR